MHPSQRALGDAKNTPSHLPDSGKVHAPDLLDDSAGFHATEVEPEIQSSLGNKLS